MNAGADTALSVVTGANTGIGLVTARELARAGHRVVLACRSESKTRPVIEQIVSETANPAVEFLHLDLADFASVRSAADTLIERGDPIRVLVANAGLAGQRGLTAQGFELAFGVNHLGHFLFVTRLLDLLRSGTRPGDPARVVVVASRAHEQARGIDFEAVRRPTRTRTGLREYGVSKLANVCFAQELARRIPGDEVWVGSLHPGVIASDVWRNVPGPLRRLLTWRMASTEEGARTSLMCATSPEVLAHHGGYFSDGHVAVAAKVATPELGAELWRRSEDWVSV